MYETYILDNLDMKLKKKKKDSLNICLTFVSIINDDNY